jgi:hypothetical protein
MPKDSEFMRKRLGTRIIQNMPKLRYRLDPAIVPEFVAWIMMIGERYERLYTSAKVNAGPCSDHYLEAIKENTELRIACLQDLINVTNDNFSRVEYNSCWIRTADMLGISSQDLDPNLFYPCDIFEQGEGI